MKTILLLAAVLLFADAALAQSASCDVKKLEAAMLELDAKTKANDTEGDAFITQALETLSASKGWKKQQQDAYLLSLLAIPEVSKIQAERDAIGRAYFDALTKGAKGDLCGTLQRSLPSLQRTVELSRQQWAIIRTRVESDIASSKGG